MEAAKLWDLQKIYWNCWELMKKIVRNSRKEKLLIIFMIKRRNKREHRETTRADDTQRKNRTAIYCWFSIQVASEEFVRW